jgi:hypothetical protein
MLRLIRLVVMCLHVIYKLDSLQIYAYIFNHVDPECDRFLRMLSNNLLRRNNFKR